MIDLKNTLSIFVIDVWLVRLVMNKTYSEQIKSIKYLILECTYIMS